MTGNRVFGIRNRKAVNELLHINNVAIVNVRKALMPDINVSRRRIRPSNVYFYKVIDKAKLR
jgi:hypothetical protein